MAEPGFDLARSSDKAAANQLTVDLVGTFPDLGDLCIAHEALDAVILAVSVAAVQLYCISRDAHREIRSPHFEHRRFDAETARTSVYPACHMPQPRFAHCKIGCEIREHELYALEFDDAPPRLAALVDIEHGVFESTAGNSKCMCCNAGPRPVQRCKQDLQAIARIPQQIGTRHAA